MRTLTFSMILVLAIAVVAPGATTNPGWPPENRPLSVQPVATPEPEPTPPVSTFAETPNERAIAEAFQGMAGGAGGRALPDVGNVYEEIYRLPEDQVDDALDQMSPAGNDALTGAGIAGQRRQIDTVNDHLNETRIGEQFGEEGEEPDFSPWGTGILVDGNGPLPETDEDYQTRSLGASGGVDWNATKKLRLGLHLGYTHTTVDYTGSSRGEIEALSYGGYGALIIGRGYIQGGLDQANQSYDNNRHIKFGRTKRVAKSGHDGLGRSAFLAGGYDFVRGKWNISPMLSFRHTMQEEDAYSEDGASALDLDVDKQKSNGSDSYVGLRIDHGGRVKGVWTTQRLSVGWGHNFNTGGRQTTAGFAEAGGDRFAITGPDGEANGLELSGGFTASLLGVTTFVDYGAAIAGDNTSQAIKAGFRSIF